jgi:hypothetical protein
MANKKKKMEPNNSKPEIHIELQDVFSQLVKSVQTEKNSRAAFSMLHAQGQRFRRECV